MKTASRFFLFIACMLAQVDCPHAQPTANVFEFSCIVGPLSSGATCADNTTSLRGNMNTSLKYVSAAGYATQNDGGGGDFYKIGTTSGLPPVLNCIAFSGTATFNGTSVKITSTGGSTIGMTVGEAVSSSTAGVVPPGAKIAAINPTDNTKFTMTIPSAQSGGTSYPLAVSGDNGGTLILDSATGSQGQDCFQKINYRGEPHEWGAVGNGISNDTIWLQNWLGAAGPWDATIPATYAVDVTQPLTCWPAINLRAPANDARENMPTPPIVNIQAVVFVTLTPGQYAVLTAEDNCRITGISIDANQLSNANSGIFVDALNVNGKGVIVDGHSYITNGYYNVYCYNASGGMAGMQLKDASFGPSFSDNIHIDGCPNDRLIGDIVAMAGKDYPLTTNIPSQANVYFSGDDMTLLGGVLEGSYGPGLFLDGASHISITGMYINSSGQSPYNTGGAGIELDGAKYTSICGNHFFANDQNTSSTTTAHVRFGGSTPSVNVSLCGNVYDNTSQGIPKSPDYVYDVATTFTGAAATNSSLFEIPTSQRTGVFTPTAVSALLPFLQYSPGFPNNFLTGLTLSNDSSTASQVDFAAGQAADSTNATIITLPPITGMPACTVNLTHIGPGGLDIGPAPASNTTYFFFLIAYPDGSNPYCIASASLTPTLAGTSYALFRMVGALYTTTNTTITVVPFAQNDDTFTLVTSTSFTPPGGIGTSSTPVTLSSVPSKVSVEAFGRCAAVNPVTLSAGNVSASAPSGTIFSTPPGYMVKVAIPDTAYPFALYTLPGSGSPPTGTINAAASASGTGLNCYNDGWIWHRGR